MVAAEFDYETVGESITFNSGDTRMCVDVTILGDIQIEANERFQLSLISDDAEIVPPSTTIITISNDDGAGIL